VADNVDGVHPNDTGFQKMADAWYPAVARVLGGTPPTNPPTGACVSTYTVTAQWTGGFQGDVTIRNSSTSAATGWTASFAFTAGQQISQAWNGTVTQSGTAVTARNASWNGSLPPGGTASFGFTASSASSNPVPAVSCTLN
jgi:cellulase/cellobiase CelA1